MPGTRRTPAARKRRPGSESLPSRGPAATPLARLVPHPRLPLAPRPLPARPSTGAHARRSWPSHSPGWLPWRAAWPLPFAGAGRPELPLQGRRRRPEQPLWRSAGRRRCLAGLAGAWRGDRKRPAGAHGRRGSPGPGSSAGSDGSAGAATRGEPRRAAVPLLLRGRRRLSAAAADRRLRVLELQRPFGEAERTGGARLSRRQPLQTAGNLAGPDAHPHPPRRQGHAAGPGRWAERDLRPGQSLAPRGQEAAAGPHLRPGGAAADAGETPGRGHSCCHLRGPQEPRKDLTKPESLGSRLQSTEAQRRGWSEQAAPAWRVPH